MKCVFQNPEHGGKVPRHVPPLDETVTVRDAPERNGPGNSTCLEAPVPRFPLAGSGGNDASFVTALHDNIPGPVLPTDIGGYDL